MANASPCQPDGNGVNPVFTSSHPQKENLLTHHPTTERPLALMIRVGPVRGVPVDLLEAAPVVLD
jgi:hypothetical protein